jgi:rifampin ADP-ribosylating transferase
MSSAPLPATAKPCVRYFHGGNRGLKVGDYILPPSETGSDSASDFGAQIVHRKDRVYVSTRQTDAQLFASVSREPVVYEVEPEGELAPDPDCTSGVSFTCPKAKVIAVHRISGKNIKKARKALIAGSHRRAREAKSKQGV